jgi:hypothetical protein
MSALTPMITQVANDSLGLYTEEMPSKPKIELLNHG